ncbi:SBBP repeat-containing protein [candidate division KSB1 bacterium]|nr:SBBP repeat-containing protein [candidate division KSB1 bacterium]
MNHDSAKSKSKKTGSLQIYFLYCVILFATNPLFAIDSLQVSWSTYIGGSQGFPGFEDGVDEMIMDNMGNLYIVGQTRTSNLPNRTNQHPSDNTCAFAAKLNSAGTILWSTYIGGSNSPGNDGGFGITIDPGGEFVYITGKSTANDIPGVLNPGWGSGAFVASIRTSNGQIRWSRVLTNGGGQGNALCVHSGLDFLCRLLERQRGSAEAHAMPEDHYHFKRWWRCRSWESADV